MDREDLTTAEVADLCQSVLQLASPPRLERAIEGSDNQVWYVDYNLVVRISLDPEGDTVQYREIALRNLIKRYLENPSVIPDCLTRGVWGQRDYAFCLETRIHGVSLEKIAPTAQTEADLVSLLSCLRHIPMDKPEVSILPVEDELDLDELDRCARFALERLSRNNQLSAEKLTLDLADLGNVSTSRNHPRVLLHADLKGEHILVNEDTGSIIGILDWTDAKVGDPAIDIGGLAISVGAAMAARVGLAVGYSNLVVARGIFLARCDAYDFLDERLNGEDDSPIDLLKKQLERAVEDIEL